MFPVKYRWPVFALDATPEQDYAAIIDEETQGPRAHAAREQVPRPRRSTSPTTSGATATSSTSRRRGRSRAANVEAFFTATFDAWKDRRAERPRGGLRRLQPDRSSSTPRRSSTSSRARTSSTSCATRGRPTRTRRSGRCRSSLASYMLGWTLNQQYALLPARALSRAAARRCGSRTRSPIPSACSAACASGWGSSASDTLAAPSWNGQPLDRGLSVGHDPGRDARGEPRDGRRAHGRGAERGRAPRRAVSRTARLRQAFSADGRGQGA